MMKREEGRDELGRIGDKRGRRKIGYTERRGKRIRKRYEKESRNEHTQEKARM